jgi:hypothetical protein
VTLPRTQRATVAIPSRAVSLARRILALSLALTACQTVGPQSMKYGRGQYNQTVQRTDAEQLLLNLVRLRYRDPPLFLEVTSIATSLSLELGTGVTGNAGGINTVTPSGSVLYTERPTITYAPLHGSRFGQLFMTPIEPRVLLLLYHSGWAIDRILKVFVQRIGSLPNAPRASGPTPDNAPKFQDFFRACEILRHLWHDGHLEFGETRHGEVPVLVIHIDPSRAEDPMVVELARVLGLPQPTTTVLFGATLRSNDPALVPIVTRSLLAAMYYASQGVDPPELDLRRGKVTRTQEADGADFDWTRVTGKILRVHHASRRPSDAFVAVSYRGHWWYIDDTDLDSKSTFSFLSQTVELLSNDVRTATPVLTLPISAG